MSNSFAISQNNPARDDPNQEEITPDSDPTRADSDRPHQPNGVSGGPARVAPQYAANTQFRVNFPDAPKGQPPKVDHDTEDRLARLKHEVLETYRKREKKNRKSGIQCLHRRG